MTLAVRLHPEAREELAEAVRWYAQRRDGLGSRFRTAVRRCVLSVADWPESAPVWPGWDRMPVVRAVHLLERWPYRVVYFVDNGELWVVAVAHDSRLPGYWKSRVLR